MPLRPRTATVQEGNPVTVSNGASSGNAVRFNEHLGRYELDTGNEVAFAEVRLRDDRMVFTHTEVPFAMRHRGIGSKLVRGALDDVRRRGIKVVPQCWFVAQFISRNCDYADLRA